MNRLVLSLLIVAAPLASAEPIQLHPKNPHYFLFRGKPTAIITSGEHYGMVLNPDLDDRRYLDTLRADGMNYTRLFSGSYVEKRGAFGIQRNNLAPGPGRFLAPWARSPEPGYAGGGNKFDLDRWNPDYFVRLKDFVTEAGRHGIVVELTLFSSIYNNEQWSVNPFNPSNNVNGLAVSGRDQINTVENGNALVFQERLVRRLVRELTASDNVIYELQNEPWSDHHVMGDCINPYLLQERQFPNAVEIATADSLAWQARVASWIVAEERGLPNRHLIAQNVANFRLPVREQDVAPGVSILNFHYAYPEAVTWNFGLDRVLGYDETGFAGSADTTYRREAWNFILAGGGLFNHLDYSFTAGHEDGTDTEPNGPGGGSPTLRRQLRVLSEFLHSFDLPSLAPDPTTVKKSPGVVVRTLSARGRQYALYLRGVAPCELTLDLPNGSYRAEWVDPRTGEVVKRESFRHRGKLRTLGSPAFEDDIALRVAIVQREGRRP